MAYEQRREQPRERSLPDLVRELSQETTTLIRQEFALAKAELQQQGKQAGIGLGMFGVAGVLGLMGAFALTAFAIFALAEFIAPWLSALIVGIAILSAAAIVGASGKEKISQAKPPAPQTRESVKEDVRWLKDQP